MHKLRQLGMIAIVLGMMSIISIPALAQDMSNGADNFYKSKEVTLQKVTFKNQIFDLGAEKADHQRGSRATLC